MTETAIILLATLGVVVFLLLTAYLIIRADRRDKAIAQAAMKYHQAAAVITELESTLKTQVEELGYVDPQPLVDIFDRYRTFTNRRELQ